MSLLTSFVRVPAVTDLSGVRPAPFVAGRHYDASPVIGGGINSSTGAVTADRLYACPFWVGPKGFDADRIGIRCSASAAGNFRAGVYTHDPVNYRPSSLISETGSTSVGGTGYILATVDWTITAPGPHYLVWLAIVFDATPTMEQLFAASTGVMGWDTASSNNFMGLYMSHTFGALPASYSSTPTGEASARRIVMRNG